MLIVCVSLQEGPCRIDSTARYRSDTLNQADTHHFGDTEIARGGRTLELVIVSAGYSESS